MGVTIVEDSRQKDGRHAHVEAWMRAHGVGFLPRARALPFGDYVAEDGEGRPLNNTSVDTKQGMQELAMDLTRDHDRFRRECLRAREAGWRLVILVEEHHEYDRDLTRVAGWVSGVCRRCEEMRRGRCDPLDAWRRCARFRAKPAQGPRLRASMLTMRERYGVRFRFCRRADAAREICELLGVGYGRDDG